MAAIIHLREYWRAYLLNMIFVGLLLTTHTLAYGDEAATGEFSLTTPSGRQHATLQATEVDIKVNGILARVIIKQQFHNPSAEWAEGEYVFPLPPDSTVDYMAMTIAERKIVGKIRERETAQKIYQAAKQAGRKASLVAQQRPNLFTNRVANIAPGESIEVELHYLQTLHYDQGRFTLRVPTTLTPRYIPGQAFSHSRVNGDEQNLGVDSGSGWASPTDQVPDAASITPPMQTSDQAATLRLNAAINAGFPLAGIESLHHPADIRQQLALHTVRLKAGARLDRDVVLEWEPAVGQAPLAAALGEHIRDEHYYLFMVMPPQDLDAEAVLPRETIFIIDTSGSMAGNSIVQARQALMSGLEQLKPGDRFNIVEFNSHTRPLWQDAVDASAANLRQATHFVNGLHASGGTEMKEALAFALRAGEDSDAYVRQVIFITDGSVGNEAALFDLIANMRGNSRLFTVGIGSAPNSHFMQKAAESGRGSFTYVGSQNEVRRTITDLFHKLQNPMMTDIQLDLGSASAEQFPRQVPDLYAGEPLIVAARFTGPVPAYVLINGRRNGKDYQQQLGLSPAANAADISKLWARKKLHQLYDDERNARSSPADAQVDVVRGKIVDLAVAHQLMSKYTSFIAVESTVSRPENAALKTSAIPNAMPAGNTMAIPVPAGALGLKGKWLLACFALAALLLLYWQGRIQGKAQIKAQGSSRRV